jgi:formate-dependent nitrite reductase cytochrome c552 subunit
MARDRLDASEKKHLLIEALLLPGRVILWLGYMFPSKGYSKVRQSSRHARSPIMTALYSAAFWIFLMYLIINGGI